MRFIGNPTQTRKGKAMRYTISLLVVCVVGPFAWSMPLLAAYLTLTGEIPSPRHTGMILLVGCFFAGLMSLGVKRED